MPGLQLDRTRMCIRSLIRLRPRCLLALTTFTALTLTLHLCFSVRHAAYWRYLYKKYVSTHKLSPDLDMCPFLEDEQSKGPITADTQTLRGMAEIEQALCPPLSQGGHFTPHKCRSKQKVALIVPYRDRLAHLKKFLWHIHPFLQRQLVEYAIFVIEQDDSADFNRGILMNIGFKEALQTDDYNCFVFHDVDLLPLDDRILYRCSDMPVHLSAAVDTLDFKLMYEHLFGGACALTKAMMEDVNGFSNLYFGWGGEDDDMSYRIRSHGMTIVRYSQEISKYTMLRHTKADHIDRSNLMESGKGRIHVDGLNSLKYERLDKELKPLYTWVKVKVSQVK